MRRRTRLSSVSPRQTRCQTGSSIILVIVALGIVSLIAAFFVPMFQSQMKQASRINANLSATALRSNIVANIQNNAAWGRMVADSACNPSLRCLIPPTDCRTGSFAINPNEEHEIRCLHDASGLIFNQQDPTAGFSESSDPCDSNSSEGGYSAENGNPSCPFRARVTWRIADPASCNITCVNPAIKVRFQLEFSSGRGFPFNTGKFSQEIDR